MRERSQKRRELPVKEVTAKQTFSEDEDEETGSVKIAIPPIPVHKRPRKKTVKLKRKSRKLSTIVLPSRQSEIEDNRPLLIMGMTIPPAVASSANGDDDDSSSTASSCSSSCFSRHHAERKRLKAQSQTDCKYVQRPFTSRLEHLYGLLGVVDVRRAHPTGSAENNIPKTAMIPQPMPMQAMTQTRGAGGVQLVATAPIWPSKCEVTTVSLRSITQQEEEL